MADQILDERGGELLQGLRRYTANTLSVPKGIAIIVVEVLEETADRYNLPLKAFNFGSTVVGHTIDKVRPPKP